MITIHKEGGERLPYNAFFFSGGEPHIELQNPEYLHRSRVTIDARIGDPSDMILLLAVTSAVKQCFPATLDLQIPYFPGGRQDRQENGYAFTLKMYADLINAQGYDMVSILDPHSAATPALIDRVVVLPHVPMIRYFLLNRPEGSPPIVGLICPDAGAEKRTLDLAAELKCENVVFARKERDVRTGELSGFSVPPLPVNGSYLLADDICDGGGTFIGLANEIRKDPYGHGVLVLWVTHGIFSKGLDALFEHYGRIGCTDSLPQAAHQRHHADEGHRLQITRI